MTLHYQFPNIHYWHTVAKHFEGNPNFIIVDKGDYFVVNYVMMGDETFPAIVEGQDYHRATVLREGRGLIFCSKTGELLSRPFQKFFNLGERPDTSVLDLSKPHVILEKLDGSMIRPLIINGHYRLATKMGVTDVSMQAEEFVAKHPNYDQFFKLHIDMDYPYTPIFEWCSRQQRIVVDYPEDKLVLVAYRCNYTGEYFDMKGLEALGKLWDIPVVKSVDLSGKTQEQIIETVRAMEDAEGIVIRFDDGHMVKVKADAYVRMHKAKSYLSNERTMVRLILEEQIDDVIPLLLDRDKKQVQKLRDQILYDVLMFQTAVAGVLHKARELQLSRKEFALKSENADPILRAACFKFFDDILYEVGYIDYTKQLILKNLGSKQSYEKIKKSVLKTVNWNEKDFE